MHLRLWLGSIRISRVQLLIAAAGTTSIASTALAASFAAPQSIAYEFGATSHCFSSPTVLPHAITQSASSVFTVAQQPSISIGSYPLFSRTTCIAMKELPSTAGDHTITLQSPIVLAKKLTITTESLPVLTPAQPIHTPLSTRAQLLFEIDKPDNTFSYSAAIGEQKTECTRTRRSVQCPLEDLSLAQGTTHEYTLRRHFKSKEYPIISNPLTLVEPLTVLSSSIANDQLVYEHVTSIAIQTSKPLDDAGTIVLTQDGVANPVAHTLKIDGPTIYVTPDSQLDRDARFTLTATGAVATNTAFLEDPFAITFTTSSGPKVLGTNIASFGVSSYNSVLITLDTSLSPDQNVGEFVTIATASGPIAAIVSSVGQTLTINPTSALPACTPFTITVAGGLTSIHGVSGGNGWSFSSRTVCQKVASIGSSVQGRSIPSYRFGSGSNLMVFVGGTHGTERSSVHTLNAWIDELEQNYDSIPASKTIVVIPNANPDAYTHGTRTNANNVDLNRNFPSNDWASQVYGPGGSVLETGGGTTALSEPESAALAAYIQSSSPSVVLTYHAVARAVIANGSGNSQSLANTYASLVGFASYSSAQEDGLFEYATTGEFETWLHDKVGTPTLLIELATSSGNEIATQKSAMWNIVNN